MVAFGFFSRFTPNAAPRQGKQCFGKVKTCSPAPPPGHAVRTDRSTRLVGEGRLVIGGSPRTPVPWPPHEQERSSAGSAAHPHRHRRTRARGGPDHHRPRRHRLAPTRYPPRTGTARERTGALYRPVRGRRRARCAPRPGQTPWGMSRQRWRPWPPTCSGSTVAPTPDPSRPGDIRMSARHRRARPESSPPPIHSARSRSCWYAAAHRAPFSAQGRRTRLQGAPQVPLLLLPRQTRDGPPGRKATPARAFNT